MRSHLDIGSGAEPRTGTDARERLLAAVPAAERRLELAGISTAVLEGGAGPPLVLLHGPGAHAAGWLRVLPALTTSYRVVAPDLPGHGHSGLADGPLDAERVLGWLEELVERTCPSPPVLVGQLVGGALGARFAADHADRLRELVLVVPLGLAPFEPTPAFGAALTGYVTEPGEDTHDELWEHCVRDLGALRRQMAGDWDLLRAYNVDRARTPAGAAGLHALMELFGLAAIDEAVLARIGVPTSLVWGRHDSIVPLSVGERASARYGWPLHVIETAGNEPALEAPAAFLRALDLALHPTREGVAR